MVISHQIEFLEIIVKYLFWIGIGALAMWFVYTTNLLDVVILFLIAGAIPGTNILLPPVVMFILLSICLLLTAWWLKRQQFAVQIRTMKARHETVKVPRPQISETAAKRRNRQLLTHWLTIIFLTFRLRNAITALPGRFSKKWFKQVFFERYVKGREFLERGIVTLKR